MDDQHIIQENDFGGRIRSPKFLEWAIQVEENMKAVDTQIPIDPQIPKIPIDQQIPIHELVQSRNPEICIYKIPKSMESKEDEDVVMSVYRPCKVSLGPYHHGDDRCQEGEQKKNDSLVHFLQRSPATLEDYWKAVSKVADVLRSAYDELDPVWEDSDAFVRMMILDGCFLLELLHATSEFIVVYNPVFQNIFYGDGGSELQFYRHDVLLLENQLPMSLLRTLLAVQLRGTEEDATKLLEQYILEFFPSMSFFAVRTCSSRLHLLDVSRSTIMSEEFDPRLRRRAPWQQDPLLQRRAPSQQGFHIPTAAELHNARIKFRCRRSGTAVSFKPRNTLCLPTIVVGGATKSALLNTIAFEKLHCAGRGIHVTAYLYFMQKLIHNAQDVRVLQSNGVIVTSLSADEIAQLFRRISQPMSWVLDPDRSNEFQNYIKVGRLLRERYNRMSDEWRKDLFQNYLKSPWAIVSVFAATLIFTLTAIQTVYTVLGYVNRN